MHIMAIYMSDKGLVVHISIPEENRFLLLPVREGINYLNKILAQVSDNVKKM